MSPPDTPPPSTRATPSSPGYWRRVWRRFRRNPAAMLALACVLVLGVVAVSAPVIVGTRPIVCRYDNRIYFPCLYYVHPGLENPVFRRDQFRTPFYKSLQEKDPTSWAIYPLVYRDPERRVSREEIDELRPPRSAPEAATPGVPTGEEHPPEEPVLGDPFGEETGPTSEPETDDGPPNGYHWMGVTNASRIDVFAVMVHGARVAMLIGLVTTCIAASIGILLGAIAGYLGGWMDMVISRLTEFFMSIPVLILIIALLAVIDRPSIWHVMLVLGLTGWTGICRLTRAEFLKLRTLEYVTAARALGAGVWRILFRHMLPNAMAPILVPITFGIASAILTESGLSLLGLGAPPDTPSWGGLLNRGRENFESMWWLVLYPSVAIFSTVLAFNLIGEGMQQATDPRLQDDSVQIPRAPVVPETIQTRQPAGNVLLEVTHLSTWFHTEGGVVKAVDDITLRIEQGRTLGIIGESGSGKSVTAYSIMRLLSGSGRVMQGSISLLGRELVTLPEREMCRVRGGEIGMIFQEPMSSLNPVYTVGWQIVEAIRLHHKVSRAEARRRAIALLREVGMPDPERRIDSYPHELSGGQKQRVMIAMALSCAPKLLIADEPTTALDVTIQAQILDVLRRAQVSRRMSVLFITHDLGVIARIADDVAVMYQGKVVESGSVAAVFRSPQHPYTRALVACRVRLHSACRILPTVADFMDVTQEGDQTRIIDRQMNSQRLTELHKSGRGRLLSPVSRLAALGYPLETMVKEVDTTSVAEGETPLLSVNGLTVTFPLRKGVFPWAAERFRAVDGISFEIYQGQTLGLVGESGCGKSTAARAILRLIEPDSGQVVYDGIVPARVEGAELRRLRRRMQIIFQDPYASLNPRMTVENALIEPMVIHGIGTNARDRRDRAVSLLNEVGLEAGHLRRYPHEFSGGQRQRISIARALAVEPELIVCDEPVSSLDVSVQAQVLNLLKRLQQQRHLTYLFISHDLSVVKFMADMMAVMKDGRIMEFGPSESIYRSPREQYTRDLIAAVPAEEFSS